MTFNLVYVCVILTFCLSAPLLSLFGISGTRVEDNIVERIHPLVVFVLFSFLVSFFLRQKVYLRRNLMIYYLNVMIGIWWMLYSYGVNDHPATIPLVSYVGPFLYIIMLIDTTEKQRQKISNFVHIFMVSNALVALGEFTLHMRLLPALGDSSGDNIIRVNALIGHPLTNATVTGAYILSVISNIKSYKRIIFPSISIAICLLSLAAFGGRTATAALLFFGALIILKGEWVKNCEGLVQRKRIFAMLVTCCVLIALLMSAYDYGLFDRFIGRLQEDYGSANTRKIAWDAIMASGFDQLFFGREDEYIVFVDYFGRISATSPEIFWLNLLFYNGFMVLVPVTILFLLSMNHLRKEVSGSSGYVLLFFLVCVSGSVGLGGKTQLLAMVSTIILSLCNVGRVEGEEFKPGQQNKLQRKQPSVRFLMSKSKKNFLIIKR